MANITVDVQQHIAVVTLDRPPTNSLVRASYHQLHKTFDEIGEVPGVRAVVLRGAGRCFCTGNDVHEFVGIDSGAAAAAYAQSVSDGVAAVYNCKVPVIAAVHGHALGAGMAIAACADVIVAADDSVFGIPEIKVGVIGAAAFLGLIVPEKVARYLSLTGESISAREIKAYGGIQSIVPVAEVFDRAMEVATAISHNAPTGVRYFKEAMNTNQNARLVEKYAVESAYAVQFFESPESRESVSAFFEKRMPDFD